MMYVERFVCAVKVGGKILREKDGMVSLPFNSEFSILLKNLESRLATAKVSIDGEDVLDSSELLICPNSSFELNGFLKKNEAVNRFRFIEKTEKIENHRGNKIDDGILRIEFRFQKQKPIVSETIYRNYWDYQYPHWYWNQRWYPDYPYTIWTTYTSSGGGSSSSNSYTARFDQPSNSYVYNCSVNGLESKSFDLNNKSDENSDGITVHGSEISQQFVSSFVNDMEEQVHVMIIKMSGYHAGEKIEKPVMVKDKIECSICGTMNKFNHKFCAECGTFLEDK